MKKTYKLKYEKGKCSIPSCDKPVAYAELCSACYQAMYYWHKRSPKQVMRRYKQLKRINERMDILSSVTGAK